MSGKHGFVRNASHPAALARASAPASAWPVTAITGIARVRPSRFNVRVTWQDTTDPSQDGIVLSQDPQGGAEEKPGTVVTLTVGRLVTQTDTTDTTTTP